MKLIERGKQMNDNKLSKLWIAAVVVIPFILIFCLHIGIALGNYFGININVPNVDASTWFLFAGSYLGGVMTLAGVMITLKHERKIHQYEKLLENIDKEKERLGKAICELNVFAPSIIYQKFMVMQVTQDGYNASEIAAIRSNILEEMAKINKLKSETMFFTDIYAITSGCRKSCRIKEILPEIQKIYDTIGKNIYDTLQEIDQYVTDAYRNSLCDAQIHRFNTINVNCQALGQPLQYNEAAIEEYEVKKVDVKPKQDKIAMALTEISSYPLNEIQQLNYLVREYIVVKQQNASKNCFINKREKE